MALAVTSNDDLDGSLDVFRTLESDELQVEIRPAPGARKRPREEEEENPKSAKQEHLFEAEFSDSDEDDVRIVLCNDGPKSGGMKYYLGRMWEKPAHAQSGALTLIDDSAGGDQASSSTALALVRDNQAEVVEKDEGTEEIMAKLRFHMDEAELADTLWRKLGANLSDYFNFELDEASFKALILKQCRIRLEARQRQKISVLDGHTPRI
eukprot:TRINITY_DN39324_c0_g1_i1.p1 TRINITY_DN39324_c0_g1~~TRINITY_DN39324_c0_g1_i1.p1  ORF type:complete len:209 (-),score=43.20 TRINITY_DN39324_c0_g1_i1:65-691(-)